MWTSPTPKRCTRLPSARSVAAYPSQTLQGRNGPLRAAHGSVAVLSFCVCLHASSEYRWWVWGVQMQSAPGFGEGASSKAYAPLEPRVDAAKILLLMRAHSNTATAISQWRASLLLRRPLQEQLQ